MHSNKTEMVNLARNKPVTKVADQWPGESRRRFVEADYVHAQISSRKSVTAARVSRIFAD